MKMLTSLVAATLLGVASVAGAQVNMPTPGQAGSSPGNAVRLVVVSEMMIDRAITRWLRAHYPGWNADPHELMQIGTDRYAVVYITSPNNPGRRVYFRVVDGSHPDDDDGFPDF